MQKVNALTIRNRLGQVLKQLAESGEPILVSKGRKVQAVLITLEQYKRRFLDFQAEEERRALLATIKEMRSESREDRKSLDVLRELRGYG